MIASATLTADAIIDLALKEAIVDERERLFSLALAYLAATSENPIFTEALSVLCRERAGRYEPR